MAANAAYIESFESRDPLQGSAPFFWTMIAMAVLDVILLFWAFNPISSLHKKSFNGWSAATVEDVAQADNGAKPSPLGALRKGENHRYVLRASASQ
jgi:hypothetical protein